LGETEGRMAEQKLSSIGVVLDDILDESYWRGATHELQEQGYLEAVGEPTGLYRIIRPLPDPQDFEAELRARWTHDVGDWLTAIKTDLTELMEQFSTQDDPEENEARTLSLELFKHLCGTYPFDIPEPYSSENVYVTPKSLPATCAHRFEESLPEGSARLHEARNIALACATRIEKLYRNVDGQNLVTNLRSLAGDIKDLLHYIE